MKKIAQSIVRLRKLILTVAVLLLIPSAIGAVATRINYDVLTYLPQELDSMIGEVALEDDFHLASTGMITVEARWKSSSRATSPIMESRSCGR